MKGSDILSFDLSILGVKRNIPKVDFRDYSGLIQAPAKWGKTKLISKLPKTVLVAFESGYDYFCKMNKLCQRLE